MQQRPCFNYSCTWIANISLLANYLRIVYGTRASGGLVLLHWTCQYLLFAIHSSKKCFRWRHKQRTCICALVLLISHTIPCKPILISPTANCVTLLCRCSLHKWEMRLKVWFLAPPWRMFITFAHATGQGSAAYVYCNIGRLDAESTFVMLYPKGQCIKWTCCSQLDTQITCLLPISRAASWAHQSSSGDYGILHMYREWRSEAFPRMVSDWLVMLITDHHGIFFPNQLWSIFQINHTLYSLDGIAAGAT